jgi:hypothetical protein
MKQYLRTGFPLPLRARARYILGSAQRAALNIHMLGSVKFDTKIFRETGRILGSEGVCGELPEPIETAKCMQR